MQIRFFSRRENSQSSGHSQGSLRSEVRVAQLCPTLCNPVDDRVHGILQPRILEWVACAFTSGPSQPRHRTGVFCLAGGLYQLSYQGSPKALYRVLQKAVSLNSKEEAFKQMGGPLAVGQEQKCTMLCEPPCSCVSRPAAWREVSAHRCVGLSEGREGHGGWWSGRKGQLLSNPPADTGSLLHTEPCGHQWRR